MLNKRYIKSIKRDIFVLISFPVFLFQFLFCYILERKDKKWLKRDMIVLNYFLILFVSISFLVNIGKEMSLPGFRINLRYFSNGLNLRHFLTGIANTTVKTAVYTLQLTIHSIKTVLIMVVSAIFISCLLVFQEVR